MQTQTNKELDTKKKKQREETLDKYTHKLPIATIKKSKESSKDLQEKLQSSQKDDEIRLLEGELQRKQEELNEIKSKEKNIQNNNDQKLRELVIKQ